MKDLEKQSRDIVAEAQKKLAPIEYIRSAVRQMDPVDVADLAVAYLYAQVKQRRRAQVRDVEQSAQASTPRPAKEPRWGTVAWDRWAVDPANAERAESTRRWRAKADQADRALTERLHAKLGNIMEDYIDQMHMKWTAELLASEFALGDGTVTTWGAATREQHAARMAMHKRNAVAGMEGYARHAAAVATLEETGATCLAEAVGVAA